MMLTEKAEETKSQTEVQASSNGGTSVLRACINGINGICGVGILSIPFAVSAGGWMSLPILLVISVLCGYTGLLLGRCMDTDDSIKTYSDIGHQAFGYKGRVLASIFIFSEVYFSAVEFLILEGDNLDKLFPNMNFNLAGLEITGKQAFVLLAAFVILPTTWLRSLGSMAYVSVCGVFASMILASCVFWIGTVDGVGFHEKGELVNWRGVPTTISIIAFSYGGHTILPTIRNSLKNRNQYSKVFLISLVISTFIYGSVAISGYLMYGNHLKSQVTLNLPIKKFSAKLAIFTTLVNPLSKYAIIITPITTTIENSFLSPKIRKNRFICILIRTTVVISTTVVALTVPFFGYVMAFTGAFSCIAVALLLPCLFYLRINKAATNFGIEFVILVGIIVIGFVVAVIGTYTSIIQLVNHL